MSDNYIAVMPVSAATMKVQGNKERQSTPEQLSHLHDMSCMHLRLTSLLPLCLMLLRWQFVGVVTIFNKCKYLLNKQNSLITITKTEEYSILKHHKCAY